MEQEFYITRLYLDEKSTQSARNVFIKFDTWKNIENCTFLEEIVLRKKHVNK